MAALDGVWRKSLAVMIVSPERIVHNGAVVHDQERCGGGMVVLDEAHTWIFVAYMASSDGAGTSSSTVPAASLPDGHFAVLLRAAAAVSAGHGRVRCREAPFFPREPGAARGAPPPLFF